ncbi:MAG: D-alanyl-D-alanine carboxypeptidase family protein [Candidatus Saccharibacteria bacterium]|nr:D-alanyl-D-alanine carboxypeptidase family protein [Candidatus Saccharibacteria bacterium]
MAATAVSPRHVETSSTHINSSVSYILIEMRKQFVLLGLIIVLLFGFHTLSNRADGDSDNSPKVVTTTAVKPFNKSQYSLTDPSSIWVVVNKQRPLDPKPYIPGDLQTPKVALRQPADYSSMKLRKEAANALEKLFKAAEDNKTPLRLSSGYRSYNYQVSLYAGYVQKEGQVSADAESARPGFSEHQTGLAVDVGMTNATCDVEQCFGDTPAGKWVAAESYKYGFIIRYPQGLTQVTGYEYEPWHIRYVGVDLATQMHDSGVQTMEQFFNLGDAPDY